MSTPITFFRHRERAGGQTSHFEVTRPDGPIHMYVYSRRPLDDSLLQDYQVESKELFRQRMEALRQKLVEMGDGGVIAEVGHDGKNRKIRVSALGHGYQAPAGYGELRPGRPLALKPLSREWFHLPAGHHLLLPVDAESEEQLAQFAEQLAFFPADLESLMLNAIRRPSLDSEVARLKAKVFGEEGGGGGGWLHRQGARIRGWVRGPYVWLLLLALLVALLILNAFWMRRIASRLDVQKPAGAVETPTPNEEGSTGAPAEEQPTEEQSAAAPAASPQQAPGTQSSPPTREAAPSTSPKDEPGTRPGNSAPTSASPQEQPAQEPPAQGPAPKSWTDLFAAVEKAKNPQLKILYEQHFKRYDAHLRTLVDGRKTRHRDFVWGFLKLQIWALNPAEPSILTAREAQVKDALRNAPFTTLEPGQLDLLAFLACQLSFDDKPNLKTVKEDASPVPIANEDCNHFTREKAAQGLPALKTFIDGLSGP